MCGIFGYVGPKEASTTAIEGLKKLEYRGYDSAGIAVIQDNKIMICKEVGKVASLEKEMEQKHFNCHNAIAHTRWATHGKPSKVNAHPHVNTHYSLAIVHNGIIENHAVLRASLMEKGVIFVSETDTEVIAHLISEYYQGDLIIAVQKALALLKGAFAIALIHQDFPDQIIAFTHECPLVIGIGVKEAFVSSDSNAFSSSTREVVYLSNGEIAVVRPNKLEVYNSSLEEIAKDTQALAEVAETQSKGDYQHYTLKEIHEQPQAIRNAILGRIHEEYGTAIFENLQFTASELLNVDRILILACGTSWHAGFVAAYMIEEMAHIPVQVEISSEFRYKNQIISKATLVIAISQSGETADTLAAVKELKTKGAKVLALCNVTSSSLVRVAHSTIFLRAGQEIGVCSTKAFTSQVVILSLFSLLLARIRHMSKERGVDFINHILKLPEQAQEVLDSTEHISQIAKKYARYDNFFFLGRSYMYPACLEGALKLKEISYINANGYAAGEMKHGPIALINEQCPSVAFCANYRTLDKMLSNLMEVKARNGKIIAIMEKNNPKIDTIADDIIYVPSTIDELAAIPSSIAAQLLAYYIALERGTDIDQPRNLAKSVTVE